MIPSLNALKTAAQSLLLERVDVHHAISVLEITSPNDKNLPKLKGVEHDLYQVIQMLVEMIEQREIPET